MHWSRYMYRFTNNRKFSCKSSLYSKCEFSHVGWWAPTSKRSQQCHFKVFVSYPLPTSCCRRWRRAVSLRQHDSAVGREKNFSCTSVSVFEFFKLKKLWPYVTCFQCMTSLYIMKRFRFGSGFTVRICVEQTLTMVAKAGLIQKLCDSWLYTRKVDTNAKRNR